MVLEVAILDVKKGLEIEFEDAFKKAHTIISSMKGYQSHQLQNCIENNSRYILFVNGKTLDDHKVGFREKASIKSGDHFYNPFPEVEHDTTVFDNNLLLETRGV